MAGHGAWLAVLLLKKFTLSSGQITPDKNSIHFLFFHKNLCCGYSLEMPQWGACTHNNTYLDREIRKIKYFD